ncbi:MAG: addiction module protein [Rhodoferax sp.]|nr:addiction module protein [Rhodoferax sp.]
MNTPSTIEQTVLHLSKPARAHLVSLLLDSLDEPSETDVQQLWLLESQRRAAEIDAGVVDLVSGNDLERQVKLIRR